MNPSDKKETPQSRKAKRFALEHWHIIAFYLMVYDFAAMNGAYFLALWLRFDCRFSAILEQYMMAWLKFTPIYVVVSFAVFWLLHLYQSLWRFASFSELKRVTLASAFHAVGMHCNISVHANFLLFHRSCNSVYVGAIHPICLPFYPVGKKQERKGSAKIKGKPCYAHWCRIRWTNDLA